MLTPEEFEAILERIRTGSTTEADLAALRQVLKLHGEFFQVDLRQEKYNINIGKVEGQDIQWGDRLYYGADAETIRAVLKSVLSEQQRILEQQRAKRPRIERAFLGMMQAEVVDSLKQSLHHAVLMNLGKEEQPKQVERLWDAKIKVADQPNVLLPNDTKTIEVFDREDIAGRLLILGNPGSGKTTTLLELAKALIERAETEPDFPMPVLFNLSSWKDDKQPLHEWIVQELKLRGVSSNITRKCLSSHKLLPLLDGLDEMASDRQEICVKAINQQLLTGEKSLPYLVVCSRNEEYNNYETKLLLNGAISIQELSIDKIQSYLYSIDQSELCHVINRDPNLLALVRTPLFLSIAALSFRKLFQERWQTLTTTEARIEYLLNSYTQQMLERPIPRNLFGKWQLPSNQKTRRWLTWLAQQMQRESQSEFLIEGMQPSWLVTTASRKAYRRKAKTVGALTLGLMGGSLNTLFTILVLSWSFFIMWLGSTKIIERPEINITPKSFMDLVYIGIAVIVGGLITGLIIGLIISLITSLLNIWDKEIELIELLNFSFRKACMAGFRSFTLVMMAFIALFFIICLMWLVHSSLIMSAEPIDLVNVASQLLPFAIFIAIFVGLRNALVTILVGLEGDPQKRNCPNQGIRKSLINAITAGILIGIPVQLILQFVMNFLGESIGSIGGFLGFIIATKVLLENGGKACAQHLALRLTLYQRHCIPWNYSRFLDYCTERSLLQRIGGRYRFIHRLLQEHFAAMPFDKSVNGDIV